MGSAQSARRTQPGGGSAARAGDGGVCRFGGSRSRPGSARCPVPPPGALSPRRCVATGSGSAWKGSARRWVGGFIPSDLYSAHRPDLAVSPRGRGKVSQRRDSPPGESRGPPPPARLSTWTDCSQCVLTASRRPGGDRPSTGARGLRRCRLPTRPVLKHGPRSLTRARVRGLARNPVAQ